MIAHASAPTPRILIVGTGESGKSLMAKSIAKSMQAKGFPVTVYDPILTEWGDDAFVTADGNEFFDEVYKCANEYDVQFVFVDEADTLLSISDKPNHKLLTRGRHYGLRTYVVTQRPALVAPTIRTQCNELYCFKVAKKDAQLLSEDFAHDGLLEAPKLAQGEYLHVYWRDKQKVCEPGRMF